MYTFEQVKYDDVNEYINHEYEDRLIFQTKEWIDFVAECKSAEPIVLRIKKDGVEIGFFTSLIFKVMNFRIVGSPFRGWTTLYMGFNMRQGESRVDVIPSLWKYVHKELKCFYMEIIDWNISVEEAQSAGLTFGIQETYVKDISEELPKILKSFSSTCKNQIHRFEKNEARLEVVEPSEKFAEEYYKELERVFGYQGLEPSYDLKRVKSLLSHLKEINKDTLYTTIAYSPEGTPVGTLIGFGYGKTAYLWGLTIIREKQFYQSDALLWDSFKHWKELGYEHYDLVGVRPYKLKFHPDLRQTPRITCCNIPFMIEIRDCVEKMYWVTNKLKECVRK